MDLRKSARIINEEKIDIKKTNIFVRIIDILFSYILPYYDNVWFNFVLIVLVIFSSWMSTKFQGGILFGLASTYLLSIL